MLCLTPWVKAYGELAAKQLLINLVGMAYVNTIWNMYSQYYIIINDIYNYTCNAKVQGAQASKSKKLATQVSTLFQVNNISQ